MVALRSLTAKGMSLWGNEGLVHFPVAKVRN